MLPIGAILDSGEHKYRIVGMLGQGGFGITYKATAKVDVKVGNIQRSVDMPFAVKEHFIKQFNERKGNSVTIPNSSNVEEVNESIGAFLTEAQRLNRLSLEHPGIVKVNESFRANGTAYYVMEYIEGESLRHHVEHHDGGRLPEEEAVAIIQKVGASVQYLHDNRVNHLDIKPDNILLRTDGQPVLIDFGLSKHYDKRGKATSTLKVAGTSDGYSPLEQYAGLDRFSPQADVYALAATVLFMLAGNDPQKATDTSATDIKAALKPVASVTTANAVVHAMSMLSQNRTASVNDFLAELNGNGVINRKEVKSGNSTVVINPSKLRLKPKPLPWKRISAYSAGVVGSALFVWGVITVVRNNKVPNKADTEMALVEQANPDSLSAAMKQETDSMELASLMAKKEATYDSLLNVARQLFQRKDYTSAKETLSSIDTMFRSRQEVKELSNDIETAINRLEQKEQEEAQKKWQEEQKRKEELAKKQKEELEKAKKEEETNRKCLSYYSAAKTAYDSRNLKEAWNNINSIERLSSSYARKSDVQNLKNKIQNTALEIKSVTGKDPRFQ